MFGVTARDPGTFLAMLLVLTIVAIAAGYPAGPPRVTDRSDGRAQGGVTR